MLILLDFIEKLIGFQDIKINFINRNDSIGEISDELKYSLTVCPKYGKIILLKHINIGIYSTKKQ